MVGIVLQNEIKTPGGKHSAFPKPHLNLLHKWNIDKKKPDKKTVNIGGAHIMVTIIALGMIPMLKKRVKEKTVFNIYRLDTGSEVHT